MRNSSDAKSVADKYIARDGSAVTTSASVPAVRAPRLGWFTCSRCGKEEQINPSFTPDVSPSICVKCSPFVERERPKSIAQMESQLEQFLTLAEAKYQEAKIAANEGRVSHEHVEAIRLNIDGLRISQRNLQALKNTAPSAIIATEGTPS